MDYKAGYSNGVENAKRLAHTEEALNRKISGGRARKEAYGSNWQSVDINDAVARFAPGAEPVQDMGKIIFKSFDGHYEVITDIGGGYLRIFDKHLMQYVDLNGRSVLNYTDNRGKQHRRSKPERHLLTHFRIKKREEM